MGKSIKALINPELLSWARTSLGLTTATVADELGVSKETYEAWESGDEQMTLAKLRDAARVLKRPLAVFYLPKPPKDFKPLRDFRRPHGVAPRETLSPELLLDIRRAHSKRAIALDLVAEMEVEIPTFDLRASVADDAEIIGQRFRDALAVPPPAKRGWKTDMMAVEAWKVAAEQLGVLVFHATKIRRSEARGFSISVEGEPLPIVVIALKEYPAGRIFTLMHELTHLALRATGVCDWNEKDSVEAYCNRVAGAILVPKAELEALPEVAAANRQSIWSDESLERISQFFRVSEEVVLRRLVILNRASAAFYRSRRQIFEKRYEDAGEHFGRVDHPVKVVRSLGHLYVGLVLDAYRNEAITSADVTDYLGVKLEAVPEIEQVMIASQW